MITPEQGAASLDDVLQALRGARRALDGLRLIVIGPTAADRLASADKAILDAILDLRSIADLSPGRIG